MKEIGNLVREKMPSFNVARCRKCSLKNRAKGKTEVQSY